MAMSSIEQIEHVSGPATSEAIAAEHVHNVNVQADMKGIVHDAKVASDIEHRMPLWQGVKTYPKAIAWSMALSSCIIMVGYDTLLLGSFFAMPAFNEKYGQPDGEGGWTLSAAWQIGLGDGTGIGSIVGVFLGGWLAERYGYRRILQLALLLTTAFVFITFFAPNLIVLEIGIILCGIPWGMFQTITVTYAADVCPTKLRCYLTNYINLCWIIGQLIGSGILRGMTDIDNQWSYKIPFAVQWAWPLPISVAVWLAPESPWWLVRKGRLEEAKRSLNVLASKGEWFNADDTVAMMIHTNKMEMEISEGTSYLDCFKGVNLRRTEIVVGVWLCQCLCGEQLIGYTTYFYEQAGLNPNDAFSLGLGQYGIGVVGALLSWVLMTHVGRRTIFLGALTAMCILLFVIGGLGVPAATTSLSWSIGTLMLIWTFVYDLSVGPVTYSLIAEIPSSRLRPKTVGLGIIVSYVVGTAYTGVIGLYMLNSTAWNWGAKAGFFWAAHCAICVTWVFFRLPEPKGRTYAELDLLFARRTPAREFANTVVDPYELGDSAAEVSTSEKGW